MLKLAPKKELKSKWVELEDSEKIEFDYLTNEQDLELTYLARRCYNTATKKLDESFDLKYKQLVLKYGIKDWKMKDESVKCVLVNAESGTELEHDLWISLIKDVKQVNKLYSLYQEYFGWDETDKKK